MTESTTEQSIDFLKKIEYQELQSASERKLTEIHNKKVDEYLQKASQIKNLSEEVKKLFENLKQLEVEIKDIKSSI